ASRSPLPSLFFFPCPSTPHTYTLSLHDALPIFNLPGIGFNRAQIGPGHHDEVDVLTDHAGEHFQVFGDDFIQVENFWGEHLLARSEEHTSELQSRGHLVCRLLLEKKKNLNRRN